MPTRFLFLTLLAVFLYAGCSSEAPVDEATAEPALEVYAITPVAEGESYLAESPAQHYVSFFEVGGVTLMPPEGDDWSWFLSPDRLGCAGQLEPLVSATPTKVGDEVVYSRGIQLQERYRSTSQGLEQGFVIQAPPCDAPVEIEIGVTLGGDLEPELSDDGAALTAKLPSGHDTLAYGGLVGRDLLGRHLPARLQLGEDGLSIVVHVAGAVWPISIQP